MRYLLFLSLCILTSCTGKKLQPADLLFHVSPTENAITSVTEGMVDHVAIVLSKDSVIEAISKGVVKSPISSLLLQDGYYIHARIKGSLDKKATLSKACGQIGKPYDVLYLADNDSIYCTELVQISYTNKQGKNIFKPVPMSFHNESGQITSYWRNFYKQYGMEVPEGLPGTNPNEMIHRENIRQLGKYTKQKQK